MAFIIDDGKWKFFNQKQKYASDGIDFGLTFEDIEEAFFKYGELRHEFTDEIIPIRFIEDFEASGCSLPSNPLSGGVCAVCGNICGI